MITVLQRVSQASVSIDGAVKSSIENGLLVLVGIEEADDDSDIDWLIRKITSLRIFNDDKDVMNLSCEDINGSYLVVSQFTLQASTKKGNRPSYIKAARPEIAIPKYEKFIEKLNLSTNGHVGTGEFGADMKVNLLNDGPVTIILDTKNKS